MKMRFKKPASFRIAGLAIGVGFSDESHAAKIQAKCRRERLLVSNEGTSLLLLPALNIDQVAAAQGLDILERCV